MYAFFLFISHKKYILFTKQCIVLFKFITKNDANYNSNATLVITNIISKTIIYKKKSLIIYSVCQAHCLP